MADSTPVADAELVARTRAGDAGAFDTLVRRHYRAAFAVALAAAGTAMDAEDACQDGFVKALERIDECRDPARFAGWLLQIIRNRAHNVRAYQRRRDGPTLEVVDPPAQADTGRAVERRELRARLEAALATLPPVQREVVLLHDLEGWKHQEIASALGTSEGMSRQHLFAARKALRVRLAAVAVSDAQEHQHD